MSAPTVTDPARQRMFRSARFALHLITVLLVVVTVVRAIAAGVPLLHAMLAGGVFLAWYGSGAGLIHGRGAPWWLGGLAVLWGGMLVISPEFVWLSFPLLLLAGHLLPGWWAVVFAVPVLAAAIIAPVPHQVPMTFAHIVGPLLGGGFALAISVGYDALLRDAIERERLIASLVRAQEETTALQEELARTQREAGAAAERTRLARDLHDTIAQELSSMVLFARSADAARMPQIEQLAQHSLTELRRIVAALAPAELEEAALAGALERMLQSLHDDTGIATDLQAEGRLPQLPTPVEVVLLRIAQSALANVRRHADARTVRVGLDAADGEVHLTIADDGVGFDPDQVPRDAPATSYGLVAMRDRLEEIGGGLEVRSAPGDGCTIAAGVPLRGAGR